MGLLYPTALLSAALIPLLVLAYLVRERPRRVTVSSVLAFRALAALKGEMPWGRPRLDWMFYVEVLILALAVAAMAGPYVIRQRRPLAVVLDNSAAMQARMPSGATRFEAARERLLPMLAGEAPSGGIALYLTTPVPHQHAAPFENLAEARSEIGRIALTDAPDDPDAVQRLLSELASGQRFNEVIFAGTNPLAAPLPPTVRPVVVGGSISNLALGSFVLRRESFGADTLQGRLTLANFSPQAQTLRLEVAGDGKPLAHAEPRLEAREITTIEFPRLALADVYRAQLEPGDEFPLDNVAFATAGSIRPVQALFVSPTPADAAGLGSLPGVRVQTEMPEAFSPAEAAKADLIVFEYAVPKELPATNTLLVMPPPADPVFNFATRPASDPQIASWKTPDPLTDGVNFRLLDVRRGEFLGPHPWMEAVVSGSSGALLLSGMRQGHRFVAAGFNPFPYLGRRNLPMSVLTLNLLSYLAGLGADSVGYRTGQPWLVPAGVEKVVLPSGAAMAVRPGTLFAADAIQGVYQLVGADGEHELRATNLADLAESDLENRAPLRIASAGRAAAGPSAFAYKAPLARYLIAALLVLAALEGVLAYRRRPSAAGAQP